MDDLIIQLSSTRKNSNGQEYRMVPTATCGSYSVMCDSNPIGKLCKILISSANYPGNTGVKVMRGTTPVFDTQTLLKWASGKGLSTREQPEHLRRYRDGKEKV